MKIYATFQSVNARVEADYVGTAVNGDVKTSLSERPLGGHLYLSHAIILLGYLVPFVTIGLALIITVIIVGCQACNGRERCKEIKSWKDKFTKKLENNVDLQGNIAASAITCISFATYVQFLDFLSIGYENILELPSYFVRYTNYFFITITIFCALTVLVNVLGFVLLALSYCCKKNDLLYISVILCIGNTILVLSYHFQYILMAWALAPFYAGSILLYYGVIIFFAFLSLKYTYICTHNLISKKRIWLGTTLVITTGVLIIVIITTLMFIIFVPIDGSIENSAVGITTIYHGGVLLIGGLVAYKMGGYYFGKGSFSFNSVLKTAATKMRNNPFNRNDPEWELESEEERMSKVVNMMIKYGNVYSHLPVHLPPPAQTASPTVYVTHIDNRTCALANPSINYPFTFQSYPIVINDFNKPSGIAVVQNQPPAQANGLQQGDVLVVENGGNRVSKIVENNGKKQRRDFFGAKGGKDGQFNQPTGIAVNQYGKIFVVDHGNHRVQKFSQSGAVSRNEGGNDTAGHNDENGAGVHHKEGRDSSAANDIPLQSPLGTAETQPNDIDSSETSKLLKNEERNASQNYSGTGASFNGGGNGVAAKVHQLKSPVGIAVAQQKVYISDTGNSRIQVYDHNLNYTNKFGREGEGEREFKEQFDLSIDSGENLYVVDRGNKRIQVFNVADQYLREFGSDTLIDPVSIAIDIGRNDTVYVVDCGNNCVSKFTKDGEFIGSFSSVALSEPSGIAVDHNTEAVYVCDTGNNRVILFNKDLVV